MHTPVLVKHSKHFSLKDSLAIGVGRTQRDFEPMRPAGGRFASATTLSCGSKADAYRAFVEGELDVPRF